MLEVKLMFNEIVGGLWLVIVRGETYSLRGKLKGLGFTWKEFESVDDAGGNRYLRKAWMIRVKEDDKGALRGLMKKLKMLGVEKGEALENLELMESMA